MLRKGDESVPGYRLVRQLGEGGTGIVWQASGPGQTTAALKFLSLSAKNGIKEYKALQRVKEIRHANLLPIHAIWMLDKSGNVVDEATAAEIDAQDSSEQRVDSTMFIGRGRPATMVVAMPLGDKNLLDRLHEFQKMGAEGIPTRELLDVMEDAARGIDYLNSKRHDLGNGIVAIQHRDIKPQNILLVGDSAAVCDFGLARDSGSNHVSTAMAGTPAYIAPECIQGRKPSHATDQYSLAISYCELRTGKLPFDNTSFVGVMEAHKTGDLDLSRLTPDEQKVIRRATAMKPDDRFTTSLEMIRALRRAVEGAAPVIHKSSPPEPQKKQPQQTDQKPSPPKSPLASPPKTEPPKAKPTGNINPALLQTVMDPGMEIERMRRATISGSTEQPPAAPSLDQVFAKPQQPIPGKTDEAPTPSEHSSSEHSSSGPTPTAPASPEPATPKPVSERKSIGRPIATKGGRATRPPAADRPNQPPPIPPRPPDPERKPKPTPKRKPPRVPNAEERWVPPDPGVGNRNSQAMSLLAFVVVVAVLVGLIFWLF